MMKREQADGGVFINYRQRDSSNSLRNHALLVEALSRRLARHFSARMVFIDTSMSSGTRYPDELRTKLAMCHVLLAIIHPEWLDDLNRRQGAQVPDWVLDEISIALNGSPHAENGTARRPVVIPVLLERAELPTADELPEKIRGLADLEKFRLRAGSLADDIARLVERLEGHVPAPWQPGADTEPKPDKFEKADTYFVVTMFLLALISIQSTDETAIVKIVTLMNTSLLFIVLSFLSAAVPWLFGRWLHQMEQQINYQPRQYYLIGSSSFITIFLLFPMIYYAMDDRGSFQSAATTAITFLAGFSMLLLGIISITPQQVAQEDHEWPPRVHAQGSQYERVSSLQRAGVRLEERLTSSWRPPLSRVQRDQAQHIVQQLSKNANILRDEAERGRLDWTFTEQRLEAVMYAICLTGTVGLAVVSTYLLIGREYTGWLLYLAVLTPVVAPGLCVGTMELRFRHERKKKSWCATEVEENLEKRLLPHLPPEWAAALSPEHTGRRDPNAPKGR